GGSAHGVAAFLQLHFLSVHLQATLTEREDEPARGDVVAPGMAVLPHRRAGTRLYPLAGFLFTDVLAVARFARLRIEPLPNSLKDRFFMADVFSSLPVQFPQDTVLACGEDEVLAAVINKNAFEHNIEIQRFTGSV